MSSDEQRQYIKEALTINQLLDAKVLSKIKITDESAKSYYDLHQSEFEQKESVRASHILVLVKENASADEKKKAEEKMDKIRKELDGGADFADVAKKFSEDPGSAKRGGELGFFSRGMMVKPFEEAAFALKDGETSGVVTSRFGMHIIKRHEHKSAGLAGFDEVKEKIKARLKRTEVQKEMGKYIASVMAKRKVVKYVN
jgi:peptidyl-prolyl cis-trans isomerase C